MRNKSLKILTLGAALLALLGAPALAEETLYSPDALIVPMDTTYQDYGMLEAYGLVYQLLLNEVPVDWVIEPGKELRRGRLQRHRRGRPDRLAGCGPRLSRRALRRR